MITVIRSASSGRTGHNTDNRHPLPSAAPQPRFTFTHGLALGGLVLTHTDAHSYSRVRASRRVPAATLVGFSYIRDKRGRRNDKLAACEKRAQSQCVAPTLCTVAGLPHVAAGAARGVGARGPLAGGVFRDIVALADALQRVHLAHAHQHGPRGHDRGGAQVQR